MNARIEGAVDAICDAIAVAGECTSVSRHADIVNDCRLNPWQLETLRLILEEIFGHTVPEKLWDGPLYRTAEGMAEWLVRQSDTASWAEIVRQRRDEKRTPRPQRAA